ncbi:SGNH/GDSL hydrolase family protein [Kribbella sp. NPDC026611]|uniref:SGNH/GDSL hydrolase family protein n=1 Tax=Kribbella sp. NPDC026611 TaxID=3154911 RepID=UPI0033E0B028
MTHTLRRLTTSLLLVALLAGLTGGDAVSEVLRPALQPAGQLRVVALGDSVTSGHNCNCAGFPQMYGGLLADRTGAPVAVNNLGVAGLDSNGLLTSLDRRNSTMQVVTAAADVVLLTIGANDFSDHQDDVTGGQCSTECTTDELDELTTNMRRIIGQIHTLRGGSPTTILVTGYWNVFQDGDVARRRYPPPGRLASDQLTREANKLIADVGHSDQATYVDIYNPFEDHPAGITTLLAPDGDHPNAAGHRLIAQLLLAATPNGLGVTSRQGG